MSKVVIGIVSKHFKVNSQRPNTYIRDEVKQAVLDNGAIAIGILTPDREIKQVVDNWEEDLTDMQYTDLISQIDLCDGVIFQGGEASDNYECIAARYCYEKDIPTLGICCGQNIIARAIGGTTYEIPNPEKHMRRQEDYVHSIKIDKNSLHQTFISLVFFIKMLYLSSHLFLGHPFLYWSLFSTIIHRYF